MDDSNGIMERVKNVVANCHNQIVLTTTVCAFTRCSHNSQLMTQFVMITYKRITQQQK